MNAYLICTSLFSWTCGCCIAQKASKKVKTFFFSLTYINLLLNKQFVSLRNAILLLSVWEDLTNCLSLLFHCHPLNFAILARRVWYSFSETVNLFLWNMLFMNISFVKYSTSLDHGKCDEARWCFGLSYLPNSISAGIFRTQEEAEEERALARNNINAGTGFKSRFQLILKKYELYTDVNSNSVSPFHFFSLHFSAKGIYKRGQKWISGNAYFG